MNRLAAECAGTFALVFAGTGAAVVNEASNGAVTHPGIAITFGLVVMAMIFSFGHVSGAHINPAVTIAFAAAKRFPWSSVPGYIVAQCVGAVGASLLLRVLFTDAQTLGGTVPAGSSIQSFALEIVLTLGLMLVILAVTSGPKVVGSFAAIAIGGVVGLEAMFAGPICGASMNPARSLGPAVMGDGLGVLWIYLIAPVAGALLAIPIHAITRARPDDAE